MKMLGRIALLAILVGATAAKAADAPPEGYVSLFNGKDLAGWKSTAKADAWTTEKDMIVCKGGGGGWLLTDKEYGDFDFRCEFRWTKEGGNSGVALRTPEKGNPAYVGMEIQLIDDDNWEKVRKFKLADYQHTGSIYDVKAAKLAKNKPIGEWNSIHITCKGPQVTIRVNDQETVNVSLQDFKAKFEKHPGLKREKGHLGLQSYNDRVEFRNIFVKELK